MIHTAWQVWVLLLGAVAATAGLLVAFPEYWYWVLVGVAVSALVVGMALAVQRVLRLLPTNAKDPEKLVTRDLSFSDVEVAIDALRQKMTAMPFVPEIIVGVDRGGAVVAGLLGKALRTPITLIAASERWRISQQLDASLDDGLKDAGARREDLKVLKNVLLVDDACRRGGTLTGAHETISGLEGLSGATIRTAVILYQEREIGPETIEPDFWGYKTKTVDIALPWDPTVLE